MKVTGFTFIRNALNYDFPVVEAIKSILPVCDDFVVAVGQSEDATLELVRSIKHPRIQLFETQWDDTRREGGKVLAIEADKAFQKISSDTDWAFYIQGDEVVHERYLENILREMKRWKEDSRVDGLLFNYLHFYGSYDYVATSSGWYKKEIRIIRNNKKIYSYRDAQGFRKENNKKLNVKPIEAFMYHYGWVKPPAVMQKKRGNFSKYWHDDSWVEKHILPQKEFDYSGIDSLSRFHDTHPSVMLGRIKDKNWKFDFEVSRKKFSLKEFCKLLVKKILGWEIGYRNYKIIG